MVEYHCHECGQSFSISPKNDYGTYEFDWCPNCGSGKTTLAH